jgi:hypothetical protein
MSFFGLIGNKQSSSSKGQKSRISQPSASSKKSPTRVPGSGVSKDNKQSVFDKLNLLNRVSQERDSNREQAAAGRQSFSSGTQSMESFKRRSEVSGSSKYVKTFKPKENYVIDAMTSGTQPRPTGGRFGSFFSWFSYVSKAFIAVQIFVLKLLGKDSSQTIHQAVRRQQIFAFVNKLIGQGLIAALMLSFVYISFFDRYFLVKTYTYSFGDESYLATDELQRLSDHFSTQSTFGFLPENQYWYLNERNLTLSANEIIPEVNAVRVKDRTWPNQVHLEVDTEPILATLVVTERRQERFWRVSQTGRVISEDEAGLREKLIEVQRPISFDTNNADFQDYRLEEDYLQLNRLWFANWLWLLLEEGEESLGIEVRYTAFPSLTDTDVLVVTDQGTELWFDSNVQEIARENQESRIRSVFRSDIYNQHQRGELAYIDFRTSVQKVFVCGKGQACDD